MTVPGSPPCSIHGSCAAGSSGGYTPRGSALHTGQPGPHLPPEHTGNGLTWAWAQCPEADSPPGGPRRRISGAHMVPLGVTHLLVWGQDVGGTWGGSGGYCCWFHGGTWTDFGGLSRAPHGWPVSPPWAGKSGQLRSPSTRILSQKWAMLVASVCLLSQDPRQRPCGHLCPPSRGHLAPSRDDAAQPRFVLFTLPGCRLSASGLAGDLVLPGNGGGLGGHC